jgi:hypothetical protein
MWVDDNLYREFQRKYGTIAADLTIFCTLLDLYGDNYVRSQFPQATYYRYRQILVEGGYRDLDRFKTATGRRPYSYKRG